MDRSAPRFAARLHGVTPYRWLPFGAQRWLLRFLPRHARPRGGHLSAASQRSARWLRLVAGVIVMAALFAVLLSAAEPAREAERPTAGMTGDARADRPSPWLRTVSTDTVSTSATSRSSAE